MVGDMVFELFAGLKGYGVYHKMVMEIIGIEVGGNNNFIFLAPHTPCGFQADFVRFFGSYFARLKALIPVIRHIAACFAEALFCCRHTLIGSFCIAVDTADIHTLIGLFIIGNILQGGVEIAVHIPFVDGFIGIFRIVYHFLQPAFHRPESRSCHIIPPTFPFAVR